MTPEDEKLSKAVARGDRAALETVYRALKDDLLSAAFHLTGDAAAAEDVLQDVFVSLARGAGRLNAAVCLRSYLMKACLNRARDLLRRRRRIPTPRDGMDDLRSDGDGPEEFAARSEEARAVAAALREIPEEQRETVVLRVYGRLKFREIAEMLSVSINTVQSRHRYALQALRARLTTMGAER
ncbi:MAG: RNA polymerase sigma factor [Planctomycetota bacterium]